MMTMVRVSFRQWKRRRSSLLRGEGGQFSGREVGDVGLGRCIVLV